MGKEPEKALFISWRADVRNAVVMVCMDAMGPNHGFLMLVLSSKNSDRSSIRIHTFCVL